METDKNQDTKKTPPAKTEEKKLPTTPKNPKVPPNSSGTYQALRHR